MALPRRQLRPLGLRLGLGVLLALTGAAAGQNGATEPGTARPADDIGRLRDDRASEADRSAAARRLLSSTLPEDRVVVEQTLAGTGLEARGGGDGARSVLLRELAVMRSPPEWVVSALERLLADPALAEVARLEAIAAVSAVRTRAAARLLLEQAAPPALRGQSREIRDAALEGLVRLTGHEEFGTDLDRWRAWFGQVEGISEAEWRRELAEALGNRADALGRQRGQIAVRLVDALRQHYLEVDAIADRSARLVAFLRDPQPEVRRLGLELAQQEIANARQLDPAVGLAAVDLLEDGAATTRMHAAVVVSILVPTEESRRVTEALGRESDPEVAAVLLKAVARWPAPDIVPALVRWLEAGAPTAAPACDALDAVDRRGWLADREMRERTLAAIKAWRDGEAGETLPPSALRLLFVLGSEDDRAAVLGMLRDGDGPRRWAAAAAVAQIREAVDPLLAAAQSDAALFPLAAQAVAAYRPSAAGFVALASVPAPDPIQRREKLLGVAQELSHSELLRAARSTRDPALREAMLTRLLREPLASQRQPGSDRTFKPDVISGILMLAQTRMELGQPAGALVALDALNIAADQVNPVYVNQLRVPLLLWLNRPEEAEKLDVGPDAWLDGLERCVTLEHGARMADAFEGKFAGQLSPEQGQRLAQVRSRIGLERSVVP